MPQTSSKYLASIAALELSHALQNTAPAAPFNKIGYVQLQALRQLSEIFTLELPPPATEHLPPASQAVSKFRNIIPPAPVPLFSPPGMATPQHAPIYHATPTQSSAIIRYETPRVRPRQAPSPRVTPRVIPRHEAPPRVDPILALTPYPVAPNAPYVPQGMAGENLFNTFE
jgi:hypothetical protein